MFLRSGPRKGINFIIYKVEYYTKDGEILNSTYCQVEEKAAVKVMVKSRKL